MDDNQCAQGAPKLKVAIVGSGLAGLSTAVELLDQGYEVDIYEQRPFVGGKVPFAPVQRGACRSERRLGTARTAVIAAVFAVFFSRFLEAASELSLPLC